MAAKSGIFDTVYTKYTRKIKGNIIERFLSDLWFLRSQWWATYKITIYSFNLCNVF